MKIKLKIMFLINKTLKACKQQDIYIATVKKKRNIKQATLKIALLEQQTIESFINREYTHISVMLGN